MVLPSRVGSDKFHGARSTGGLGTPGLHNRKHTITSRQAQAPTLRIVGVNERERQLDGSGIGSPV